MRFSHSEEKLKSWEGKSFEYCLESGDPDCDLPGCVQTVSSCFVSHEVIHSFAGVFLRIFPGLQRLRQKHAKLGQIAH